MTPPKGLREKKNEAAKRAFFRAAAELFREKGYDETSVDEIAQRAGFSRGTFFNHFGTKEGVLRYYGQLLCGRVEQLLDSVDPRTSPLERIRQVLVTMVQETEQQREGLRSLLVHRIRDPQYSRGPTPARQQVWDLVAGLVREAQKQGEMRTDLPAKELAFHILAIYQGMVASLVLETTPAAQVLSSGWRFILAGTRGVSGDDPEAR